MTTQQQNAALIVGDGQGNHYAIRREALEQYRIPPERVEQAKSQQGNDVQGFQFYNPWNPYYFWFTEDEIWGWPREDWRWNYYGWDYDDWHRTHHHHD